MFHMVHFGKRHISKNDMSFKKASVLIYLKQKKNRKQKEKFVEILQQKVTLSYSDLETVKPFLILMRMKYLYYINAAFSLRTQEHAKLKYALSFILIIYCKAGSFL